MSTPAWQFNNPVRITFEAGAIDRLGDYLEGDRAVLVTSPGFRRRGVVDRIATALDKRLVAVIDDVDPNPDVLKVDEQGRRLREHDPDVLIVLGGGSSMDTAKGLARLLAQPADRTLAGHFRDGESFDDAPALPVAAIPTTSGTGAEVTPFGTIWDFELEKKYSVTGDDLYSAFAILDPELTLGLPEEVTISSGLDAVSHALESAWNKAASPVTLSFVAKSLQFSLKALPKLKQQPKDLGARAEMMQASLLAGLAISQTRTALAHSISYPLTTTFELPHGFACSFTLPPLLVYNAEADDGRLEHLARSVGYSDIASFRKGLDKLFQEVGFPEFFARYIPDRDAAMALTDRMIKPGRADNNLREAEVEDVRRIVEEAMHSLDPGRYPVG